jgi:DNA-binding LytR/AlgR family response regulator
MTNYYYIKQNEKIIALKEKTAIYYVDIHQIMYISCDCYLCKITKSDYSVIDTVKPLKYFEEELKEDGFLRINKNILVNMRYVTCLKIMSQVRLLHVGNTVFEISRRKYSLCKHLFE